MDGSGTIFHTVESSCKFTGKRVAGIEKGASQFTRLPVSVQIWVKVNDIVEIEDLDRSTSVPYGVHCFAGKNIVFRRCSFTSEEIGIRVSHGKRVGRTNGALKVTFEKCSFLDCAENGLLVGAGGNALLLDCTFFRCRVGLEVWNGGEVVLKHCIFRDCETGVIVEGRRSTADILNSVFLKMSNGGITATNGGRLVLNGCRVSDCKDIGILFVGPKRSFGNAVNCMVFGCKNGMVVRAGKNDVVLNDCSFSANAIGIYVGFDAIGYVDVYNCRVAECSKYDIKLWNGPRCAVTIDNVTRPAQPLINIQNEIARATRGNLDLWRFRLCKNAAVGDMRCFHCKVNEPEDVMYKKCGQCQQMCYCSKECQV